MYGKPATTCLKCTCLVQKTSLIRVVAEPNPHLSRQAALPCFVQYSSQNFTGLEENFRMHCCKSYSKWSSPAENSSWKSPLLVTEHFTTCPYHGILHTCWKYLPVSGARPSPCCYRKIRKSLKLKRMWVRSHHAHNLTFFTRKSPRNFR